MRTPKLAAIASAALILAACGGSPLEGKSGPDVAEAAAAALEEAGSVHVAGTVTQGEEEGEIDLHLQGDDAIGTLSMGGVDIELISLAGDAYLKAPGDFWGSFGMPAEATSMFEDQWVMVPGEAAAEFADFNLDSFIDELRNPESTVEEDVESGEFDGQAVVIVKQEDGSELSVADDENPYPLEITNKGDTPGALTLSRFGEEEDITAPADALDLTELMGS